MKRIGNYAWGIMEDKLDDFFQIAFAGLLIVGMVPACILMAPFALLGWMMKGVLFLLSKMMGDE